MNRVKTEKGKPLKPNEDNVLSSVNMWLHVCEMGIDILLSIEFLKLLSKLIPVLLFTTTWANSHNFYSFFWRIHQNNKTRRLKIRRQSRIYFVWYWQCINHLTMNRNKLEQKLMVKRSRCCIFTTLFSSKAIFNMFNEGIAKGCIYIIEIYSI